MSSCIFCLRPIAMVSDGRSCRVLRATSAVFNQSRGSGTRRHKVGPSESKFQTANDANQGVQASFEGV